MSTPFRSSFQISCEPLLTILSINSYRQRNSVYRNCAVSALTFVERSKDPRPLCGLSPEEPSECFECTSNLHTLIAEPDTRNFALRTCAQAHKASNYARLKAQHRSRARAQELTVTVSGKRRLPALAAAREGTHNQSPGECKGDLSRVHRASCRRVQSS